ncbi:MAG: anti-sigma factor [Alphaproteobacteria bacterium]
MSDRPMRIDDGDLQALVDDALDPSRRDVVEAAVAADDALAAQLAAYRQQNALLHQAFDPVAAEPVPAALSRVATRRPVWRRRWVPAAVAATLALAVGLGGGWLLGNHVVPKMRAGVQFAADGIAAHKVYQVEVRHPVEVAAAEEKHLVAWLSKRLANPVKAPHLGELGYGLVGGRLLPALAGDPAAQFMYETGSGERLTLYIRQNTTEQLAAFRFVEAGGLSAFYWLDEDLAYAIVAALPRESLMQVSREIYRQLEDE